MGHKSWIACILLLALLLSSCTKQPIEIAKEVENTEAATLIPRVTASPVPEATFSLLAKFENEIPTLLSQDEAILAKKNGQPEVSVGVMHTFQSGSYYYAWCNRDIASTPEEFHTAVYQFRKEEDGFHMLARAECPSLINEMTYDFLTAQMNGQTVWVSSVGVEYCYPDTTYEAIGKDPSKLHNEAEPDLMPYTEENEMKRTRPTKMVFEFNNGQKETFSNVYTERFVCFALDGNLKLKNLSIWAGKRSLDKANIVNFQAPEWYGYRTGSVTSFT